jgi:hypothetical protein
MLINPLNNVRRPSSSTSCLCWTAAVGNNSFSNMYVYAIYFVKCYKAQYVIGVFILWSWQRRLLRLRIHNIYSHYNTALFAYINVCIYAPALESAAPTVFMVWLRAWMLIHGCLQTMQTYSCLWLMDICTVVQNCYPTLLFYLKLPHSRSQTDWKRMGRHTLHQKPRVSWPGSKYPTMGSYRGLREPGMNGLHR